MSSWSKALHLSQRTEPVGVKVGGLFVVGGAAGDSGPHKVTVADGVRQRRRRGDGRCSRHGSTFRRGRRRRCDPGTAALLGRGDHVAQGQ